MRGIEGFNYPIFNSVAAFLRKQGWAVINPAEQNPPYEVNMNLIIQEDIRAVLSLNKDAGDAIVLVPDGDSTVSKKGWTDSVGARAEVALALWKGLPIYQAFAPDQSPHEFDLYPVAVMACFWGDLGEAWRVRRYPLIEAKGLPLTRLKGLNWPVVTGADLNVAMPRRTRERKAFDDVFGIQTMLLMDNGDGGLYAHDVEWALRGLTTLD
jgi:hypothetical protein